MSDEEMYRLPEGDEVATGLLMPMAGEVMLMGDYPQSQLLDRSDIKRALADDFYKAERRRLQKWMINQSRIGKCNPSANVAAAYQVMDNAGMPHVPLADNHLYWRVNGGHDRGSTLASTFNAMQQSGVSRRTLTVGGKPYRIPDLVFRASDLPAEVVRAADADGKNWQAIEAYKLPKRYSDFVVSLASALARRQPVIWAWHVSDAGMRLRNGYLVQGAGPGNHANVLQSAKWVDGADIVHPDNRNSWGPTADPIYGPGGVGWGEQGHALVTMQDAFRCAQYHDFYVLTTIKQNAENSILGGQK
jgi:hypothetical protein